MKDPYKMIGLLILIFGLIASGFYIANPTSYAIATGCRVVNESYIVLEPYKLWDTYIEWINKTPFEKNFTIPVDEPFFISYTICDKCKYNITFISDKPTNYFIFDEYNKIRFERNESSLPIFNKIKETYENYTFESDTEEVYYFVFDRSSQWTKTSTPAKGTLKIKELKAIEKPIERTEYRDVKKYRTVTKCD